MKQPDLKPRVLEVFGLGSPLTRDQVAKMIGCDRVFIVSRVILKLVAEGRLTHAGWKHHPGNRSKTAQMFKIA